jgi:dihydroflavonol-4-reductase
MHQRVLVTGGTGFLGYHLARHLLKAGQRVRVFALAPKPDHPLADLPIEAVWGDVRDAAAVRRAVAGCDLVFHAAGNVAVWGAALQTMREVHVEGTRNVLAAAGRSRRVVHTSSIVAVGAGRGEVFDEDSRFNLSGVRIDYVHAKRAAEEIALDAAAGGHDVVVVNPAYLVGPDDHEPSVMGKVCARAWKGRLIVAPPGGFNLADVRDVAAGHLRAARHGRPGRRYILGGEDHTLRAFIRLLADAAGLDPRALPTVPAALLRLAAVVAEARARHTGREPYPSAQHARLSHYRWYVSSARARDELGYAPRPLSRTIADTFAWFTTAGRIPLRGISRWWMRPAA